MKVNIFLKYLKYYKLSNQVWLLYGFVWIVVLYNIFLIIWCKGNVSEFVKHAPDLAVITILMGLFAILIVKPYKIIHELNKIDKKHEIEDTLTAMFFRLIFLLVFVFCLTNLNNFLVLKLFH